VGGWKNRKSLSRREWCLTLEGAAPSAPHPRPSADTEVRPPIEIQTLPGVHPILIFLLAFLKNHSKMCGRFWQNIMADTNRELPSESPIVHPEDHFHIWFEKNRQMVIMVSAAVIIVATVFIFWFYKRNATEEAASTALAQGKTVADWEKVVSTYPDSKAAPRALLLAADDFFSQGKFKESQAEYEQFLQRYPHDDFAASAQFGIAANLEAQKDYPKAVSAYEGLLSNYQNSIHNGEANIALARCAEAQGDLQKAKQILENFMASAGGSQWGREAATRLAVLNRKLAPSAPAQPNIPSLVLPGAVQPGVPSTIQKQ